VTRCGLNVAFCFIFIIHTEIFPTFFLSTSYGLCNFFGRSLTLAAPLVAESSNKMLPLIFLMFSSIMGMIGAFLIKKFDVKTLEEQETDDTDDQ
jgi:phosphotransferase system  glucose/maltose/N-acetylglucosamine-specific IIC component